jgi:hypothetical protein
MAALTIQSVGVAGTAVTFAAATVSGDTVRWSSDVVLRVKNGAGAPINVTIDDPNPCNHGFTGAAHDLVVAVAAGAEVDIPLGDERFKITSTGLVAVTYSSVTTITVAAVR